MIRILLFTFITISTATVGAQTPFITTWTTQSAGDKITIPIVPGLDYLYSVDWENDGIIDDSLITKAAEHTYPAAGLHQIAITGVFPSLYINNDSEKEKIFSIDQWGDIDWETMESSFDGAENLLYKATDTPDLSKVKFLTNMFRNATLFDADISYWNISDVLDMAEMLGGTAMSTTNYDKLLYRWSRQQVQESVVLGAQEISLCVSDKSKEELESQGWSIQDEGQSCSGNRPFIMTWLTTTANEDIRINVRENEHTYNYDVDWENDGVIDQTNVTEGLLHTYPEAGDHQVAIYGAYPAMENFGGNDKIINIDQWGDIEWQSMESSFSRCPNLNSDAYDVPDLTNVKSLRRTFSDATLFNGDLSLWDVSSVTDMSRLFSSAESFNQDISAWRVDSVRNMSLMFSNAKSFNQDISSWHVDSVTTMKSMFDEATAFNQNLDSWEVSNVTDMSYMFRGASLFNQDINSWQVDSVTTMKSMFNEATAFNQNLSSWKVSNVTDMNEMFNEATAFNQNINSWDVSNVTDMASMFDRALAFDQPLESWKVDSVTNMNRMFYRALTFNQNISSWNVTNVADMADMFYHASLFNQPLNRWDVSNVEIVEHMFASAMSFNQPLDQWKLEKVTSLFGMFEEAILFNQDLNAWDVSRIKDFSEMFASTQRFDRDLTSWDMRAASNLFGMFNNAEDFNGDITNWKLDSVTTMSYMFADTKSFNQDISSWGMSSVERIVAMFKDATAFNQDIGDWDVRNVLSFPNVFSGATSFDHDLGDWDITGDRDMIGMLDGSGLSQFNYDSTLIKWSSQPVFSGIELGAQGLIYCNGSAARTSLTTNNNWVIAGDIESCVNAQPCASSQENRYIGPTSGNWNVDANWSMGNIPDVCDDVVVPSGFIINLSDHAECYTIEISVGSVVEFEGYNLAVWGL